MSEKRDVTAQESHLETLRLGLAIIAKGSWNVGRGETMSVNEYAKQTLQAAGLWDDADVTKLNRWDGRV